MKLHAIAQNTLRWHRERMIRPTASEFDRIITAAGQPSGQQRRYMYELIFQRIYGRYAVATESAAMTRGKNLEMRARKEFERLTGKNVDEGYFVTTDDGKAGCSPDGSVGFGAGKWEGVEIKCPDPWRHMMYSVEGPQRDYRAQLQGLMHVAEFARVHFFSYCPGMPCVVHVIERDEDYIGELAGLLDAFVRDLDICEARVRALGNYSELMDEAGA